MILELIFSAGCKVAQGTPVGPFVVNRTLVPMQRKLVRVHPIRGQFALELHCGCLMQPFMRLYLGLKPSSKVTSGKSTGKGELPLGDILMAKHVRLESVWISCLKLALGKMTLEIPLHRMSCILVERNLLFLQGTVITKFTLKPSWRRRPILWVPSFPMGFQATCMFSHVVTSVASVQKRLFCMHVFNVVV